MQSPPNNSKSNKSGKKEKVVAMFFLWLWENAEGSGAAAETTSEEQLSCETAGKSAPGRARGTPERGLEHERVCVWRAKARMTVDFCNWSIKWHSNVKWENTLDITTYTKHRNVQRKCNLKLEFPN